MAKKEVATRDQLKRVCRRNGAVAFGIASVSDADALPRIPIVPAVRSLSGTRLSHTTSLADAMPDAKSIVVFAIASTDDWYELGVRIGHQRHDWPGYFPLRIIRREAAQFLRSKGFRTEYPDELTAFNSFKRIFKLAGIGTFGKNSLILSPKHGPWLRFGYFLTDADLEPDKPFEKDLCGDCRLCVRACPVGALKPYVVDAQRCLVGVHILDGVTKASKAMLAKYEPQLTPVTHVMCTRCQMVCPYTTPERRKNVIACRR